MSQTGNPKDNAIAERVNGTSYRDKYLSTERI